MSQGITEKHKRETLSLGHNQLTSRSFTPAKLTCNTSQRPQSWLKDCSQIIRSQGPSGCRFAPAVITTVRAMEQKAGDVTAPTSQLGKGKLAWGSQAINAQVCVFSIILHCIPTWGLDILSKPWVVLIYATRDNAACFILLKVLCGTRRLIGKQWNGLSFLPPFLFRHLLSLCC